MSSSQQVLSSMVVDPMVWFCIGCIMAPPLVAGASAGEWLAHLCDPWLLATFTCMAATVWSTLGSSKFDESRVYAKWELLTANWFLFNFIIHFMMDGLVGTFSCWPMMATQYRMLDKRFEFGEAAGAIVTGTELFLMAPLALITYRAIILRRPYRDISIAFLSALQLFGTISFVGTEWLTGFHNIPFDWHLEFTFQYNFYFWFGFVIGNGIWFFVTPWVVVQAVQRVLAAEKAKQE